MIEALVAASVILLALALYLSPARRAICRVATDLARRHRAARAADRRAESLLGDLLTHEERARLRDHGYLTQRITQRCNHFSVRNVRSGLARIALDESALLSIAPKQLAW